MVQALSGMRIEGRSSNQRLLSQHARLTQGQRYGLMRSRGIALVTSQMPLAFSCHGVGQRQRGVA
jgi:hypothetical protein